MSSVHNPIALLIEKLQKKWIEEVSPSEDCKLVRFVINPAEARLYEGFLRLESTPNGRIPEALVTLLPPFENIDNHSETLIKNWVEGFKQDEKTTQQLKSSDINFSWNPNDYELKLGKEDEDYDLLLLAMLSNFQKALPNKDQRLVLALLPYQIKDLKGYEKWVNHLMEMGLPPKVLFLLFDLKEEGNFDELFRKFEDIGKTLAINLHLNEAIKKIANAGNPNNPEVQFRQCMLKMSDAVNSNSEKELNRWGERGLEVTRKTGLKGFYATAHLVYGGMLFHFKAFDQIQKLLASGLRVANQGLKLGDEDCKSLTLQFYAYQAAEAQQNKQPERALKLLCLQAEKAAEYKFSQQALSAWQQATTLCKKEEKFNLLEKAYQYGSSQEKATLETSCIAYLADEYHKQLHKKEQFEQCNEVEKFMSDLFGKSWRRDVEEQRKMVPKKKFSLLNLLPSSR